MERQYLDLDEGLGECDIRNLSAASNREITEPWKQALLDKLSDEERNPAKIPQQVQVAGKNHPRQGTAKCIKKLQQLKQILVDQEEESEQEDQVLQMILSKLIHGVSRLTRLASSSSVKSEVPELIIAGNHVRSLVMELLKRTITINKTSEVVRSEEEEHNGSLSMEPISKSLPSIPDHFRNITQGGSSSCYHAEQMNSKWPSGKFKPVQFNDHQHGEPQPGPSKIPHDFMAKKKKSSFYYRPGTLDAIVCKDPRSWNLTFEGMKSHLHIENFFYRIEHMADKAYIPLEVLVDYLSLCLKGEALEWYWVYLERNAGVTWSQVKQDMIQRFQTNRSEDDIQRLLNQRKQLYPRESFLEFYDAILRLALQAKSPLSDHDIYNILKKNMRPGLQLKLHEQNEFPSIAQLIRRCVAMEDLWKELGHHPEVYNKYP